MKVENLRVFFLSQLPGITHFNVFVQALFREFYGEKRPKKTDYRIFTGQIKTVAPRLEWIMWRKFFDAGIHKKLVEEWIEEICSPTDKDRIPYIRIRPVLIFLKDTLKVHPSSILNQSFSRYESGELKSVSRKIYERALKFRKMAERALVSKNKGEIEKIKEKIYGIKEDYTLYYDVAEELRFLREYAHRSAKQYLGRGTKIYDTGKAKRIASWRADKIRADCDESIRQTPDLALSVLPIHQRFDQIKLLTNVLRVRIAQQLSKPEGVLFEKQILAPVHARDEYKKPINGFTLFEMASQVLGIKKNAFDLMVSENCELFRDVGKYANRWYISNLYLKELSEKEFFDLIATKYELMAKKNKFSNKPNACLHKAS